MNPILYLWNLLFKPKSDPVVEAGKLAASEAARFWALDVFDPKIGDTSQGAKDSLEIINEIIHRAGWTWITYKGNGPPQWCGLFAAACWYYAGIDPKWLPTFWASTLRLDAWANGKEWNGTPAGSPRPHIKLNAKSKPEDVKFPDGSLPRAGDVVVVGDETPKEGDHICVVMSYDAETGIFHTISGNGGGTGPRGNSREGISKRAYKAGAKGYHPLRVYRPLGSDLKNANR